jgi:hypothetical protein
MTRLFLLPAVALAGCALLADENLSDPSVLVSAPQDGDVFTVYDEITFQARVADPGDPLVGVALTVSSDIDGELCVRAPGVEGEVLCSATLSEGSHTITFGAADQGERTGSASVGIVVLGTDAIDDDGDGFAEADGDCDDTDPLVSPAAVESANGVDDDCNGLVDDGTEAYDDDGDGWSEDGGDCDDADPSVYPGAVELYNGIDDDCDDTVDEGTDTDDDLDGYSEVDGDCDDADPLVSPEGVERTDGVDNDCDGVVDEWDGDYAGVLGATVGGLSEGECAGALSLHIDPTVAPAVLGAADCEEGLFEAVTLEGELDGDSLSGTLVGWIGGARSAELAWTAELADDALVGSFGGTVDAEAKARAKAPDSGAADSGAADSGVADSGVADSGVADSGATDSGGSDTGKAEPTGWTIAGTLAASR